MVALPSSMSSMLSCFHRMSSNSVVGPSLTRGQRVLSSESASRAPGWNRAISFSEYRIHLYTCAFSNLLHAYWPLRSHHCTERRGASCEVVGLAMATPTRGAVLALYARVLRACRRWEAVVPGKTQEEREYAITEAKRLFRENR